MMNHGIIIPECHADTGLAHFICDILGRDKKIVSHHPGSQVSSYMKHQCVDRLAIGIVDNDKAHLNQQKRIPPYLSEFTKIRDDGNKLTQLRQHPQNNHHYIVVLYPNAIEQWLTDNATLVNVAPESFHENFNRESIGNALKRVDIENKKYYQDFLTHLLEREAAGMLAVRQWIQQILEQHQQ